MLLTGPTKLSGNEVCKIANDLVANDHQTRANVSVSGDHRIGCLEDEWALKWLLYIPLNPFVYYVYGRCME